MSGGTNELIKTIFFFWRQVLAVVHAGFDLIVKDRQASNLQRSSRLSLLSVCATTSDL